MSKKDKIIKYWLTAFDKTEENKGNPKAPKMRVILKDPVTKEEWEGALFLRKSKTGMIYLSGEIVENIPDEVTDSEFDTSKFFTEDTDIPTDEDDEDPFKKDFNKKGENPKKKENPVDKPQNISDDGDEDEEIPF